MTERARRDARRDEGSSLPPANVAQRVGTIDGTAAALVDIGQPAFGAPPLAATRIRRMPVAPARHVSSVSPRVQRKPGKNKGKGRGEPPKIEEQPQPTAQGGGSW